MYYLYHIPGKKIGVTRDLNTRVTLIQGYKSSEYEVLDQSDDIDYISDKEIELQKSYGYKVDRKKYKNLFKKMIINVTEQTSTFAVPLNKLKEHLIDNSRNVMGNISRHISIRKANNQMDNRKCCNIYV